MPEVSILLVIVIIMALAFDYVNGMHDAANAIATVVSTRALSPTKAVLLAGAFNFIGAFLFEGVAKTISKGVINPDFAVTQELILAALLGAMFWNLFTWWLGLPSSSSHAIVGGLLGAGLAAVGQSGILWFNIGKKVVVPSLIAPVIGAICGFFLMVAFLWILRKKSPKWVNKYSRYGQIVTASFMSLTHGTNDAQKMMGVITLALVVGGQQSDFEVQAWVKFACALMIALGTAAGGWRIIKTLGDKMVKLEPIHGMAAEMTAGSVLMATGHFGLPVSTTHVISGSILGVGATKRASAVRWGVAQSMFIAWVLTLPASALVSALCYHLIDPFFH